MDYPKKKEIIVVDDGSTDNTFKVASRFKGVRVLRKKQGGKASALNFGIARASGQIVVCVDSDSRPERRALMKTVPFFEEGVAAVTTYVLVNKAKSIMERVQRIEYAMIAWSRKLFEFIESIYVTPGPMSLYRRDVLQKVGGFDEKNLTEDIEIAWRLIKNNYKIRMSLDAKVYSNVPKTFGKWWHQRLRWNIGGMQTTLKYFRLFTKKELWKRRHLSPAAVHNVLHSFSDRNIPYILHHFHRCEVHIRSVPFRIQSYKRFVLLARHLPSFGSDKPFDNGNLPVVELQDRREGGEPAQEPSRRGSLRFCLYFRLAF